MDMCRDAEVVMHNSSLPPKPSNSSNLTTGPEGRKVDTGEDWGAPVRATALLIQACGGKRFPARVVEYAIWDLVELIERANNYKFKVEITSCDDDLDADDSFEEEAT